MLSRLRQLVWSLALLVILVQPAMAQVKAFVARTQDDLPPSNRVGGRVGDIVMQNEIITIVITATEHVHGGAVSGGNIVDVTINGTSDKGQGTGKRRGVDVIDQIMLFLHRYPRQGRYQTVSIVRDGSDGVAEVVAEGVDSEDGTLSLTTVYRLEARKPYVHIRTSVTNTGSKPLQKFDFGDAVQWGNARMFAPLFGFGIQRRTETLDFVGAEGYGIAYAWCTAQGQNRVINGMGWSNPIVVKADLLPNETLKYERYFIVARNLAEAAKIAWTLQNRKLHEVRGIVRSRATNKPVVGIRVTAASEGQTTKGKDQMAGREVEPLMTTMHTDAKGEFSFWLPEGTYRLKAKHVARLSLKDAVVKLPLPVLHPVELIVSGAGVLLFEVRDADTGELLPARLTFFGIKGTPTPDFGPTFLASGAENYVFTAMGKGKRTLPPGRYRIYASRGLEYDASVTEITLPEQKPVRASFTLKRSVDTTNWIGADFHMHCSNSFDSAVPLEDRIISCVGEGLEFIVMTDHNFVTDPMPAIRKLGIERWLTGCAGVEVTPRNIGHFNAFPLFPDPTKKGNGAPPWEQVKPAQIFSAAREHQGDQLIIVNHPRLYFATYFGYYKFDPDTCSSPHPDFTLEFDAIELFNGKAQDNLPLLFRDWFSLLNHGYRIFATAGSDSHQLTIDEVGYARNFVLIGTDDPQKVTPDMVVQAVKQGRVIVSLGPFVTLAAEGQPIGSLVSKPKGDIMLTIAVQAPNWVQVSEVELVANGIAVKRWQIPKTRNTDWKVTTRVCPKRDAWYAVIVRGREGGLEPILLPFRTFEGQTFKVIPMAVTNPIWIDRDGNSVFNPPKRRIVQ